MGYDKIKKPWVVNTQGLNITYIDNTKKQI